MTASDAQLPPELEKYIFELAADSSFHGIPSLLLVARRVHVWIEPYLYRVVRVNVSKTSTAMIRQLLTKPPEFISNAVRHLALEHKAREADKLLTLCKNLIDLSPSSLYNTPDLLPTLSEVRPQQLSLLLGGLFEPSQIDLSHPAFTSLTHLDVCDHSDESLAQICHQIPSLSALTHICLYYGVSRDLALTTLERCPRLKVLMIMWLPEDWETYEEEREPREYDVRFVIGLYDDYWEDWEVNARGGDNGFWIRGENFVERKRRGEIEATRYWLT
ncbi:tyrosinase central domain-containing protein [Favolaschia claudopus]|uniref:Tyrosinase central domain-containing protein n=1 Tax=Favolaschia claudopus TaxID=2862362 RepID=A0AAW0DGX8_9AGAR